MSTHPKSDGISLREPGGEVLEVSDRTRYPCASCGLMSASVTGSGVIASAAQLSHTQPTQPVEPLDHGW